MWVVCFNVAYSWFGNFHFTHLRCAPLCNRYPPQSFSFKKKNFKSLKHNITQIKPNSFKKKQKKNLSKDVLMFFAYDKNGVNQTQINKYIKKKHKFRFIHQLGFHQLNLTIRWWIHIIIIYYLFFFYYHCYFWLYPQQHQDQHPYRSWVIWHIWGC